MKNVDFVIRRMEPIGEGAVGAGPLCPPCPLWLSLAERSIGQAQGPVPTAPSSGDFFNNPIRAWLTLAA